MSRRTAVEHVRVARALAAHPRLVEEMSAGRLSFSHVRAISRCAEAGETRLVENLIEVAEHGTVAQLESVVRGLRLADGVTAQRPDYVRTGWDEDGRWRLAARLDAERGAVVAGVLARIGQAEELSREEAMLRMAELAGRVQLNALWPAGSRTAPG